MTPTELADKLELHQALDETPGYYLSEEDVEMIIAALRAVARWTAQDFAEAKAEAKELYDYFHPDHRQEGE